MKHEGVQLLVKHSLRALLALPAPALAPAPLLCFLHGYDEAAPADIRAALTRHGPLHRQAPALVRARFAVLAPQLPIAGDVWRRYADEVYELLAEAQREHRLDSRRCYLTGFSFGANGVFDLAPMRPGTWAALWPVDPTRLPDARLVEPAWLSVGEFARRRINGFVDRLHSVPAAEDEAAPRVHLDEGEDHAGCARRAYADVRIYAWLLRQAGAVV